MCVSFKNKIIKMYKEILGWAGTAEDKRSVLFPVTSERSLLYSLAVPTLACVQCQLGGEEGSTDL